MVPSCYIYGIYIVDWSANGWTIIGLAIAFVGSILSGAGYWHFSRFEARLNNADDRHTRRRAAQALTAPGPWTAYLNTLSSGLDTLDRWMGRRTSLKIWASDSGEWTNGICWSLTIALVYPPVLLLISWIAGTSPDVGMHNLLIQTNFITFSRRATFVVVLLTTMLACLLIILNMKSINNKFNDFTKSINITNRILVIKGRFFEYATFIFFSFFLFLNMVTSEKYNLAISILTPLAISLVVFITGALPFCLLFIISISGSTLASSAVIGISLSIEYARHIGVGVMLFIGHAPLTACIALAYMSYVRIGGVETILAYLVLAPCFIFYSVFVGDSGFSADIVTTVALFSILLPIMNGFFDFASWQVSRWLGERLLDASNDPQRSRWSRGSVYIIDVILDIAIAAALLIGLAWAIPKAIEIWNGFVIWSGDEPSLNLTAYLCNAAREPLVEGIWALGMLFSTLIPTAIHLLFLIFAPVFWLIAWFFGAHAINRARAAHIELGTRPPKADLVGWSDEEIDEVRAMPVCYGQPGFTEEGAVFSGKLNPQTVHKVAMELRVWRPLAYAIAFGLVLYVIWEFTPPLIATMTGPLPELLLWIANNGDWSAVQSCFPSAAPTPPIPLPWS
jgi:hypothetical protein